MASTGIITDFIFKKGFGFITPDDGSDDVFAHISELAHISEGLWVGDAVTYDKEWVERKSKHNATNINVMKRQRTITPNHLPPPSTTGTIKKFPKGMRFGFISPDDGGEDIFVHMTEITAAQASAGDSVSYKVEFDSRKAKFYAVELTASQSSRDSRAGTVGAEPSPAGQSSRDSRAGTDEQGQSSWDNQAGTVQIEEVESSEDSRARTRKSKGTRAGKFAKRQSKRDSRGETVEEGQSRAGPVELLPNASTGTITAFFEEGNNGVITPDDNSEEVFVHRDAFLELRFGGPSCKCGDKVSYRKVWGYAQGKYVAIDVLQDFSGMSSDEIIASIGTGS